MSWSMPWPLRHPLHFAGSSTMTWMRKSDLIRNFEVYFFLIAALLIVPGNTTGVFNGLPLSSIPELSGFLILLFGIFSPKFKSKFKQVSAKASPRYLVAFVLIFGIAIPAKFTLKHSDLPTGRFDACYHSFVRSDDMKVPQCEPFFSAKFEGGRSRLDKTVNFYGLNYPLRDVNISGSNWNLSFINNEQFLGRYGNYEHVRHPFRSNWVGKFSTNVESGFIPVTYVGFGSVEIDSAVTKLPVHYGTPRTEWVPVSKGIHLIKIDYAFTSLQMKPVDGVDYSSYGYYATLKVGAVQKSPTSTVDTLFGWAVDPQTFQRLSKILLVENERIVQQVTPTLHRADVAEYLGVDFENPYLGFSIFNAPGTFTTPANTTNAFVLAIGGGGGAGGYQSISQPEGPSSVVGGLGGSSILGAGVYPVTASTPYAITVGAAGNAGTNSPTTGNPGNAGGSSSFGNLLTVNGGGGGAGAPNQTGGNTGTAPLAQTTANVGPTASVTALMIQNPGSVGQGSPTFGLAGNAGRIFVYF